MTPAGGYLVEANPGVSILHILSPGGNDIQRKKNKIRRKWKGEKGAEKSIKRDKRGKKNWKIGRDMREEKSQCFS